METLREIANRMINKTGLTMEDGDGTINIKLFGDVLGSLSLADAGLLMYTSADGYDATGTEDDIQNVIINDLNNQFEFNDVTATMTNEAPVDDTPFRKVVTESIESDFVKTAVLDIYSLYYSV